MVCAGREKMPPSPIPRGFLLGPAVFLTWHIQSGLVTGPFAHLADLGVPSCQTDILKPCKDEFVLDLSL